MLARVGDNCLIHLIYSLIKMSLFKEKDDFITKAFQDQFNHSDSEGDEPISGIGLDESQERKDAEQPFADESIDQISSSDRQESLNRECINLECEDDDEDNIPSNQMIVGDPKLEEDDQVINISSDEEYDIGSPAPNALGSSFSTPSGPAAAQSSTQDIEDHSFNLKLTLAGSYLQFSTTYKTKLDQSLRELVSSAASGGKKLIVTADEKTISLEESPYTLKLKPGSILSAIEVMDSNVSNPDEITVKLQDGNRKHTKEYRIIKSEPALKLKQRYAKDFEIDSTEKIKFCFDGDVLDDESTPEDLGIEDDCVIDVIKQ